MKSTPKTLSMVKKRLASGEACRKCQQAEEVLRSRGLWERIDHVIWADESDPSSPGMQLGAAFGIDTAPFFIAESPDGQKTVYTSVLKFIKEAVAPEPELPQPELPSVAEVPAIAESLRGASPQDVLVWALRRYGAECAIAFSGAEEVVLIDMAAKSGLPFSVFCLDTGRLHPDTYRFLDKVRSHFSIELNLLSPDPQLLEPFVRQKGLFSFYEDGHQECCGVRKVEPLKRGLRQYRAWVTGQRRDQSPATRGEIPAVEVDASHEGKGGSLLKFNPLANWSSAQTWQYIRDHEVPYNALHERGFISIGCEPCTRATLPGEHERAGRWWWEEATQKECGLHLKRG